MSHKLVLEYLLTLNSSRPSSLVNNCTLACSYNLQSIKKCLTDSSGWPHLQAGVMESPIGCKWQLRYDLFNKSLYILENKVLSIKVSVSRPAYFQTFRARNLIKWVRIFVQQYHIYCKLNKLRFHILERKKQIRKRLFLRGNYITRILASFPPFAAGQLFLWTGRGRHASSTIPWWRCWRKRPSCIIHHHPSSTIHHPEQIFSWFSAVISLPKAISRSEIEPYSK